MRGQANKLFQMVGAAQGVLSNAEARRKLDLELQVEDSLQAGGKSPSSSHRKASGFPSYTFG